MRELRAQGQQVPFNCLYSFSCSSCKGQHLCHGWRVVFMSALLFWGRSEWSLGRTLWMGTGEGIMRLIVSVVASLESLWKAVPQAPPTESVAAVLRCTAWGCFLKRIPKVSFKTSCTFYSVWPQVLHFTPVALGTDCVSADLVALLEPTHHSSPCSP